MTNYEFHEWLSTEFAKYDLLNLSWKRSNYALNELLYVLRHSGREMCINTNDVDSGEFGMIGSVDAFVPSRQLAKKIVKLEYEEFDDDGKIYPLLNIECK